jgi:hypothetical protein
MNVATLSRSENSTDDIDMDTLDAGERRTVRARTEPMLVVPQTDDEGAAIGLYYVYTTSGRQYIVDIETRRACTCPDMEHNEPVDGCKHRKRVGMMIEETSLPAPGADASDYWHALDALLQRVADECDDLRERAAAIAEMQANAVAALEAEQRAADRADEALTTARTND